MNCDISYFGKLLLILLVFVYSIETIADEIPNGGTVSGTLFNGSQRDEHTFEGAVGQSGVVSISGNVSSGEFYRVFRPDGTQLTSGTSYRFLPTLTQSGTYTVIVQTAQFAGSGNYTVHLALAPGANEHGEIPNGGSVSQTIGGSGEIDSFTFLAEAGQRGVISISGTVSTGEFFRVFRPDGTQLLSGTGPKLFPTLTQSGIYTVVVSSAQSNGFGNYTVHLALAPGANEHGGIPNGGSVSQNIGGSGEIDSFTFLAEAGQRGVISISGSVSTGEFFRVFQPDGTQLLTGTSQKLLPELTQSGYYTVIVSSAQSNGSGNYTVHLALAPGANEHGRIPNGGTVSEVISGSGEIDSFTFLGYENSSGSITISGNVSTGEFFRVFRPDGSLLGSSSSQLSLDNLSPGIYTVIAHSFQSNGFGNYSISLDLELSGISYAALGDSYSSGEGVLPYRDLDDGPFSGCHRSTRAYPLGVQISEADIPVSQRSDSAFDFFACTGATTDNIRPDGEEREGEPPQMTASNGINSTRDLVTISIGGNDAYFAWVFIYCMAFPNCDTLEPFGEYSDLTLSDLAPLLIANAALKVLDLHILMRDSLPDATVVVLGYPLLVSGNECSAAQFPPFGDSDLKLSKTEQDFLREANELLNTTIEESATIAGLHYVPVAERFQGHEICGSADDWINGVVIFNPTFNPKASLHPTLRGQQEFTFAINDYLAAIPDSWETGLFVNGLPRNPVPLGTMSQNFRDIIAKGETELPEVGELLISFPSGQNECDSLENVIVPGEDSRIRGGGFSVKEDIALSLVVSGKRLVLGSVQADSDGRFDTIVSIPQDLSVDSIVTVEALGAGSNLQGRLLLNLATVKPSFTIDFDGDTIPDICDNCSAVPNSNQIDTNSDGYGNICDPDLDNNGSVNFVDYQIATEAFMSLPGGSNWSPDIDFNSDGVVNFIDLSIFNEYFLMPPGPSSVVIE